MTTSRVFTVIMLGLLPCILTGANGCDESREDICFLDSTESDHQLSPDGRAVAFINPVAFDYLLYNGDYLSDYPDCKFDCVVREFSKVFGNNPDSLIIVFDCEDYYESCARLALERGYNYYTDEIPEDTHYEIWQDLMKSDPRIVSCNRTFRVFESGLGARWFGPFPPGPSNLRGYSFLMDRGGLTWGAFLHEFCHHWAAYLDGPPVLSRQIELSGYHWGYSSVGGQLGGWKPGLLIADENGVYESGAAVVLSAGFAARPYAPLELYLMGLLGPEEVPPIEVLVGYDNLHDAKPTDTVEFPASATQTITIDAIIEANGPRLPSVEDSPKHFKLALVVLTDHELSNAEWDDYERTMDFMSAPEERFLDEAFPIEQYPARHIVWEHFTGVDVDTGEHLPYLNFYQATGGRATIEFVEPVPR